MAYVDWRRQGGLIKAASEGECIVYSEAVAMNGRSRRVGRKITTERAVYQRVWDKGKEGNKKAGASDSYQTKLIKPSNCIKILIVRAWLTWLPINVTALVDFASIRNTTFFMFQLNVCFDMSEFRRIQCLSTFEYLFPKFCSYQLHCIC